MTKILEQWNAFDTPGPQRARFVRLLARARMRAIDIAHRNGELAKERTTPSMPHYPCLDKPITNYLAPEPEITVCIHCDVDMSAEDHPSGLCGVCEGK